MSVQQCEECRLALVRVVFDPVAGEQDRWGCQLEDAFADLTRDVQCPYYVGWDVQLPAPARSCKKSQGRIDGCSTSGACSSCGSTGGCGDGGCGMGDPAEALEHKLDPEEWVLAPPDPDPRHHEEPGAHDHPHGREQLGEGPTEGDTRHRPSPHVEPPPPKPHPEPAPGVPGDPSVPEGHAPQAPDDGYPVDTKAQSASHGGACSALKALERMGLGRDEDAPVPIPLED